MKDELNEIVEAAASFFVAVSLFIFLFIGVILIPV
tara:strand:- start:259 stop:363 length:105 start_codon:yes stop_codon:yes gene_type:complete